ncbi:MAG: hypothetical protein IKY91_04850 [Akkermansia sp.]|nr:hypothetical protein [Akkermansia sp.]
MKLFVIEGTKESYENMLRQRFPDDWQTIEIVEMDGTAVSKWRSIWTKMKRLWKRRDDNG